MHLKLEVYFTQQIKLTNKQEQDTFKHASIIIQITRRKVLEAWVFVIVNKVTKTTTFDQSRADPNFYQKYIRPYMNNQNECEGSMKFLVIK